ncbi:EPIDERMAL PATTERNING FACTOR-like protein 2 [Panicum miliaceum]|uniref:Epidermal patterning factor-like protein n=1 Tax=Panicum miliaceum TaxID=4540 RepID=A0A3L6TBX5_PANMI|nr:EPIDERMAL PATTERNING FACTOR-like protein 2 [Panicum miliaceum]
MEAAYSDARRLPLRLLEVGASKDEEAATRGEMRGRRALIGSRPPRCERVCMSCGHCEAVQVPVVPQDRRQKRAAADQEERGVAAVGAAMFTYRVDGITNYKPLSWKCRCGGTILDP